MRTKHTFRLPPDLAGKLADYASRKRVPQALVVETALASFLSPDGADRLEAALARRLDRMTRQIERLERHVTISNEALALFVRFWLTARRRCPTPRSLQRRPRGGSGMRGLSKRSAGGWPGAAPLPMRSRSTFGRNRLRQALRKVTTPPLSFATPRHAARSDLVARRFCLFY